MSDVRSVAPTTTPITLAETKRHLNVSTTADDTYITELIGAATRFIEDRTNQSLINETRVLKMRGWYDKRYTHYAQRFTFSEQTGTYSQRMVQLPRGPVSSVSSITYVDATGTTQTLSSTAYVVTSDNPPQIHEAYNNTFPDTRDQENSVTITYVSGHGSTQSNVPDSVRHAAKLIVSHWYRNREAVSTDKFYDVPLAVDALLGHETVERYG